MTEDQKKMVNELADYEPTGDRKLLTPWEENFLSDIQGRQGNLSGPQANSLGQIWIKAFGS